MNNELAERIGQAGAGEQREWLCQAYLLLKPVENFLSPGYAKFELEVDRFNRMLDAEAFESAALMLVPEGYVVGLTRWQGGRGAVQVWDDDHHWEARASTPALAIASASLRAAHAKESE